MIHPLLRPVRIVVYAILWSGVIGFALPFFERMEYAARLAVKAAPQQVALPIRNLAPAAVRDSWHAPRSGGRRHEGIDLFAPRGTPIHATTEGILMRRGENKLGGKVVWVLGPGGQRHYYAHLDGFAILAAGERVLPGTILGYVGNTGNAKGTPPHLHYGIYSRRGAINPYPLLVRPAKPSGQDRQPTGPGMRDANNRSKTEPASG